MPWRESSSQFQSREGIWRYGLEHYIIARNNTIIIFLCGLQSLMQLFLLRRNFVAPFYYWDRGDPPLPSQICSPNPTFLPILPSCLWPLKARNVDPYWLFPYISHWLFLPQNTSWCSRGCSFGKTSPGFPAQLAQIFFLVIKSVPACLTPRLHTLDP